MKKLILILIISIYATPLCAEPYYKEFGLHVGTGGYLGDMQIGVKTHNFSWIVGQAKDVTQLSVKYDYPMVKCLDYFLIRNITFGMFVTYSLNGKTFVVNPDKYPTKNYYSQTALRLGLNAGIRYKWFFINTNILDTGLSYIINNRNYATDKEITNRYMWSTGLGAIINF